MSDLIDWLENAIDDSIDLGWTSRDAATLIVSRMQSEGLVMAPALPHRIEAAEGADAARYRWLRDHSCPPHNFYIGVPDEFYGVRYSPQEVDAYIDAAMAALRAKESSDGE